MPVTEQCNANREWLSAARGTSHTNSHSRDLELTASLNLQPQHLELQEESANVSPQTTERELVDGIANVNSPIQVTDRGSFFDKDGEETLIEVCPLLIMSIDITRLKRAKWMPLRKM